MPRSMVRRTCMSCFVIADTQCEASLVMSNGSGSIPGCTFILCAFDQKIANKPVHFAYEPLAGVVIHVLITSTLGPSTSAQNQGQCSCEVCARRRGGGGIRMEPRFAIVTPS